MGMVQIKITEELLRDLFHLDNPKDIKIVKGYQALGEADIFTFVLESDLFKDELMPPLTAPKIIEDLYTYSVVWEDEIFKETK